MTTELTKVWITPGLQPTSCPTKKAMCIKLQFLQQSKIVCIVFADIATISIDNVMVWKRSPLPVHCEGNSLVTSGIPTHSTKDNKFYRLLA